MYSPAEIQIGISSNTEEEARVASRSSTIQLFYILLRFYLRFLVHFNGIFFREIWVRHSQGALCFFGKVKAGHKTAVDLEKWGKVECSFHFQQMPFCTEETNALIEHHNSSLSWGRKKLIYLAFCSIALGYFCPLCDDVRCAPHTAKLLLLRFPSFNCILPAIYLAKLTAAAVLFCICAECIGISSLF